ncbi:metal ABC transporter substrate-binding protein [Sporosarcina cyprini]|uniref:metal ABC transporter substrate-binding protein n=1 Tax=Sporosarcina cyprini TaxID=2910523 RepID=UPI001EDDF677|nr:metal ABC transporter substrate-binding protein [Sporosarcina cyprini]MCG3089308.1 metal ABC transporter substrate-binding protein [Sporosarcina cyprini]
MRKNLFVLAVVSLLLLVGCSEQETSQKAEDNNSSEINMDVFIPTRESILENGRYPINDNGKTYGPNMGNATITLGEPDLMLAEGENGTIGYVKRVDLEGQQPKTPAGAVRLTKGAKPREIPLYDVDGETVIGKFIVGR